MPGEEAHAIDGRKVGAETELRIMLRRLRQERGMSQRAMAVPLQLAAHSAVADFEAGRRLPAQDILLAYERYFGLAAGTLVAVRARALAERAALRAAEQAQASAGSPQVPRKPPPRQLPHPVSDFTGRTAELGRLRKLADDVADHGGPVVISAINGAAGVGKTALAVTFAHQVAGDFPDGQLFIDLRGHDPYLPALPPATALGQLLRALGTDQAAASSADELAALFRSAVADRRMLIVLDNAAEAQQVRPLLPGQAGCLVLVTSRSRLSGLVVRDGASSELLGLLTPGEGAELFARLSGARQAADREAISEIVRLCGNLPLAIRIAAYRSAEGQGQLADLAARLADQSTVLDYLSTDDVQTGVRAAFSLSYRSLPARCARLFRLLGLHAGAQFPLLAAAALAGADPAEAVSDLAVLTDCHLVDTMPDGRYQLHDLLRVYAGECAQAEETPAGRAAAAARMSAWYLHSASAAARTLGSGRRHAELGPLPGGVTVPAFAGYQEALAFLDAECANAVATAAVAERYGLDADACHYPNVLYDVFQLRARLDEWTETLEIALRASARLGDKATRAALLSGLATVLGRKRRYDEAIEHLNASLILRREVGDRRGEAAVLGNIAIVHAYSGRHPQALAAFSEVRAIQHAVGDRSGEAMTLSNIGWISGMDGQLADAIDYISQARDIFADLEEWASHARTLSNLVDPHMRLGQYAEAADLSRQALAVSRRAGVRDVESYALKGLGDAVAEMGQADEAREFWQQALAIADDLHDPVADELRSRLASATEGVVA